MAARIIIISINSMLSHFISMTEKYLESGKFIAF
jgi:hypothetical protein